MVVAAWCASILAGRDASLEAAPPAPAARVRPVPLEPPPAPPPQRAPPPREPEPESEAPAAPPQPAPRRVGRAELVRGEALLDAGGEFPALSFGYADFPTFGSYARSMTALGARFVVVQRREIVAAVELETAAITRFDSAAVYSPRARDYTGEEGIAPLARAARERFGARAVVMMLVPRPLDAGLFGGLARVLTERGEDPRQLREIRGRYERGPAGGVYLHVESAVRRDGSAVPVEAVFDLRQVAQGTAA
jgi:hypothetical protein